ncbi:hypothetical protein ACJ41O_013262 [Fusarium nematophilum]
MFIIEVDPDFSTDFVLALTAAVTFASSIAEAEDTAKMRVTTMSWESIHPLTRDLFMFWKSFTEFDLPGLDHVQVNVVDIPGAADGIHVMDNRIAQMGHSARHVAFCFEDLEHPPSEWEVTTIMPGHDATIMALDSSEDRRMFLLPCNAPLPQRLVAYDFAHVITSETSWRSIFDLRSRQVVEVALRASTSERQQQLTWSDRTDSPRSHVFVYAQRDFINGENARIPRRMEIFNSQIRGFLAALAEFIDWPEQFMNLLQVSQVDSQDKVIGEMIWRLSAQGLVKYDDNALGYSLALAPNTHGAFYKVLPLVGYDARIAHFLCQPSNSAIVNLAKTEAAAMLAVGVSKVLGLVNIDLSSQARSEALVAGAKGICGGFVGRGTLWVALGLTKWAAAKLARWNVTAQMMPESFLTNKSLSINNLMGVQVSDYRTALIKSLEDNGVVVRRMDFVSDSDQSDLVTEEDFDEICLHLARAFSHQIAHVQFTEEGGIHMMDHVSQEPLRCSVDVQALVSWPHIHKADGGVVSGIYCNASRGSRDSLNMILDWAWIPQRVWKIWRVEVEERIKSGVNSLITEDFPTLNPDEI